MAIKINFREVNIVCTTEYFNTATNSFLLVKQTNDQIG